jgi:hypothetical protein
MCSRDVIAIKDCINMCIVPSGNQHESLLLTVTVTEIRRQNLLPNFREEKLNESPDTPNLKAELLKRPA